MCRFQRSNNWSIPQCGQETIALFAEGSNFTENILPQLVHSVLKLCDLGSVDCGNAIPPLFTLPETGAELTTSVCFGSSANAARAASANA